MRQPKILPDTKFYKIILNQCKLIRVILHTPFNSVTMYLTFESLGKSVYFDANNLQVAEFICILKNSARNSNT